MTRIDLVTGFLGAGKTTFLNRYAAALKAAGVRFAVIENEFGAAGVDTCLLKGDMEVRQLAGGCICCSQKANFHDAVVALSAEFERILVEPSGIFDLDDYYDIIESPDVAAVCAPGGIVTVLDPGMLEDLEEQDFAVLYAQLSGTGCVVLSKTQDLDAECISRARALVQALLGGECSGRDPGALIESAPWDTLKSEDFTRIFSSPLLPRPPHERRRFAHDTIFQSATLRPAQRFSEAALQKAAGRLFEGACGRVLRAKGFVQAVGGGSLAVNATPGHPSVRPMPGEEPPMLNVIGRDLNRRAIRAILEEAGGKADD
jgi:G3E family GTPase